MPETGDLGWSVPEGVAGDSGGSAEEEILKRVIDSSIGEAFLHTHLLQGVKLNLKEGEWYSEPGFNSFGERPSTVGGSGLGDLLMRDGTVEAMTFRPATSTAYAIIKEEVVSETGRWLNKRKVTTVVEKRVEQGYDPVMLNNSTTGQIEPGFYAAYQFNGNAGYSTELPAYCGHDGRPGNILYVESLLPQSLAAEFSQSLVTRPGLARDFARIISIGNGITDEIWDNITCPPYSGLPEDWELFIIGRNAEGDEELRKGHLVT